MDALFAEMLRSGVELGLAHDGDADRSRIAVLGAGKDGQPTISEIDGDGMLYIIGMQSGLDGEVATVMTNSGIEAALAKAGTKLYRADVGDRYVAEELARRNLIIGAEQAGHLINRKRLPMGDGIHTFLRVMRDIRASDQSPAEWANEIADYKWEQTLINVPVKDKKRAMNAVQEMAAAANKDLLSEGGRVLIRESGTQEVVRILVEQREGDPNELATQLAQVVAEAA
jgi:phosphoglucosamine mutase